MLSAERVQAYEAIERRVGYTPVVEISYPSLPNGNRVLAKLETANPTGSHHDRQYVRLLRIAEEQGLIIPGVTPLIETTTGSSGVSFGWTARQLGYKTWVVASAELPKGRLDAIRETVDHLEVVPNGTSLECVARRLAAILKVDRDLEPVKERRLYCVDHTRQLEAAHSLGAIVFESLVDVSCRDMPAPTDFIGVCGSGTSLLGVGRPAQRLGLAVHAWEPWASAVAFEMQQPGVYQATYGREPGTLSHRIWGASQPGVRFPHFTEALPLLAGPIQLVADRDQLEQAATAGMKDLGPIRALPRWDRPRLWHLAVGPTSLGSLAVARLRAQHEHNRTYLIIFHDASTRHLEKLP